MRLCFGFVLEAVLLTQEYFSHCSLKLPASHPIHQQEGWGSTRSWEGTWLGQLTPEHRDIPFHMASCSAARLEGRLVRSAAQWPGHQLVVQLFHICITCPFWVLLLPLCSFPLHYFLFSNIKLFLFQPMSFFIFTLSVLCSHPAGAEWASGCAQLPAGVKPPHGNPYFFFSFKITWMPPICNTSLC